MGKEFIEEKKEAIKEWIEKKKEERKGGDKDREEKRLVPKFTNAIVGKVTVSGVSCEDQGPYLVRYESKGGDKDDEKEEKDEREEGDERKDRNRRPRRPRGAFLILVKGCKRPEPKED